MKKLYLDSFSGLIEVEVSEVDNRSIYLRSKVDKFPYKRGDLIRTGTANHLVNKQDGMLTKANLEDYLPCE